MITAALITSGLQFSSNQEITVRETVWKSVTDTPESKGSHNDVMIDWN